VNTHRRYSRNSASKPLRDTAIQRKTKPILKTTTGETVTRIPLFSAENMSPEQERVYQDILKGPRTTVVGPLRASMHRPELAERWQKFGEMLRYDTSLPARLNELAILVTARRWNAQLEWQIHEKAGLEAGLPATALESLRLGASPDFTDPEEADVYEFARALQQRGDVPEPVYQRVFARWGAVGTVELSSVIGYYTLVAMTLNVHHIPLPDGTAEPLPDSAVEDMNDGTGLPGKGLTPIPACTLSGVNSLIGAGYGQS
jgi:4-carboxymuconolactone decarboxylase